MACVPRFYFHLHNDLDVPDQEGQSLSDLQAARDWAACQARILAGEMAKEEGRVVLHHRIDIEDSEGRVLSSVSFRDVLQVEQ